MKLPPWTMTALGGAGIVLLLWQHSCESSAQGALKQQINALRDSNAVLVATGRGLDTVYVNLTDTLRLVRYRTDSLLTTDTVFSVDTVRQIVDRERNACNAVVATCEEQKANLRSQIENIERQLALEKRRKPGLLSKAGWILGGVLVGRAIH